MTAGTVRRPHSSEETLERGRARRRQILDAATTLIADAGYRGATLSVIAEKVGVSPAALLHHFGSKERLLEAVVVHRTEQDAQLVAHIVGDGGLGMFDRLEMLAEHNVARPGLPQLLTVLVAESLLSEQTTNAVFVERYRGLRSSLVAALKAGQDRGEIRRDANLEAVSRRIVAALDGLQTQWLLDPTEVDLVAAYRELGASLHRELQA
jgi:AcrR family transcriptional regulator